jgi:hypothetical protein
VPKPRVPDPDEYRTAFARMDRAGRRRVMRAVNLVKPLEDPHEAGLAVAAANAQRRFWRRWWVAGPLLAAVLRFGEGWEEMLASAVLAGLMFAGLGYFFSRRALRAAEANQAVVDAASAPKQKRSKAKNKKKKRRR